MSFVKILANVSGGARDGALLSTAFAAAAPFKAHVAALFVHPNPSDEMPFFPEGMTERVLQEIVDRMAGESKIAATNARSAWKAAAADYGVTMTDRPEKRDCVTTSFRETGGRLAAELAEAAKYADLVVFTPIMGYDEAELVDVLEYLLVKSERPVVLPARTPVTTFGRKIALAWDGGFTAAHALNMAMPYLARAGDIELLCVRHAPLEPEVLKDLRDYLNLRGLSFTLRLIDSGSRPVGDALLEAAGEGKADLLVMGGYGHSRMREALFGGVTRHIISHPQIPVFMVH